jgi:hypothetical protein
MWLAQAHGDAPTLTVWRNRAEAVLAEYTARPPDPLWGACKTASYVSRNRAYHWARLGAAYVVPALLADGARLDRGL